MPLFRRPGRAVGTALRITRLLGRGVGRSGRWLSRRMLAVRAKGAGGEAGMARIFDLHAASCAGDTLVTIGLAGTIFFAVPVGEARSKVALYLLVTMVPFALLAPVVGPLLDHFRHGRRYALAATMLGRAFLAWMISDYIHGFGLYPAAFGVLALSRAYGVARSAAVPRLLPAGLGLSQAGARASVYGTVAGAAVAPLGAAAFWFGPQWPLRVASIIFLAGMVIALRLPPRADSDPPETLPRAFSVIGFRREERALRGRLVLAALVGSATLRALYGFLFLFLAFAVKAGYLETVVLGFAVSDAGALALVGGALGAGTFIATAIGTRLRLHRPTALQANGLVIVAGVAVLAALAPTLGKVTLLCLVTALISGIAKLSVDATIQERIPEHLRASAFAHSETVLMLAFVAGGALGLIPMNAQVGIGVAAAFGTLAAARATVQAGRLRKERLHGRATVDAPVDPAGAPGTAAPPGPPAAPDRADSAGLDGTDSAEPDRVDAADPPQARVARAQPGADLRRAEPPRDGAAGGAAAPPAVRRAEPPVAPPAADTAPPGFHIYRPSTATGGTAGKGDDDAGRTVADRDGG